MPSAIPKPVRIAPPHEPIPGREPEAAAQPPPPPDVPTTLPAVTPSFVGSMPAPADPAAELAMARAVAVRFPDVDFAAALADVPGLADFAATIGGDMRPAALRQALEKLETTRERYRLAAGYRAGKTPDPPKLPTREIAVAVLRLAAGSARPLAADLARSTRDDSAELAGLVADLEVVDIEPILAPLAMLRPSARRAVLEARIPARRAALEGFADAYAKLVGEALRPLGEALVSGLAEADAMAPDPAGRIVPPDPGIHASAAKVSDLAAQLGALAPPGTIRMGPIAQGLADRLAEARETLATLRAAHADRAESVYRELVDRAVAADPDALGNLVGAASRSRRSFPGSMFPALEAAGYRALIGSDPLTWAKAFEASQPGGAGREF